MSTRRGMEEGVAVEACDRIRQCEAQLGPKRLAMDDGSIQRQHGAGGETLGRIVEFRDLTPGSFGGRRRVDV